MQLGRWKLSRTRSIAVAVAAMAVGVVSCDSSDAVTAPGDAPEDIRIVLSTDSVQLAEGDTVELKGSVVDGEGRPVSGARITWISSDTAIATVTSDGKLIARQEGSVDVSASAYSIIERLRALIYRAADRLQIAGGNDQKGAAGKQLATPLQVKVVDRRGQPVAGVPIGFSVTGGGGRIEPASGSTGSNGVLSVRWTLGSSGSQTARATVTSSQHARVMRTSSVDFKATIESSQVSQGKVAITVPQGEIKIGDSVTLQAVARNAQGAVIRNAKIEWASSNPSIATVDSMGRLIARAAGTVLITAAAAGCAPDSARVEITNPENPPANPSRVTDLAVVDRGETSITLRWTAVSDGNGGVAKYAVRRGSPTLDWAAAANTEQVVEAGKVGDVVTHRVTGLTAGTKYQFGVASVRGSVRTSPVTVATETDKRAEQPPPQDAVVDVVATPDRPTLGGIGKTQRIQARAVDRNGKEVPDVPLTWMSANPQVVSVSSSGVITARAEGSARVYVGAECCGVGDTVNVTVRVEDSSPPPAQTVASVTATPSSHTFSAVGQTLQVQATARDGSGNVVSGAELSWQSTNSSVASVNNMGLVTARGAGSAMIIVASVCCSAADTVTLQVEGQSPPPSSGSGALFADDFESYSIGSTIEGKGGNGFRWGDGNGYQPRVSSEVAHSGSKSLKFPYGPTEPSGASHWWSEQRFTLGQQVKELWIEFWIYHPRGGEPLDPSDEWNRLSGSTMNRFCHPYRNPSNNKYMRLWGGADGYDKEGTWGFSANGTGNCDSSMGHEYAHYGHGVTPGYYSSPRVSLANDANRGRWVHMRFYNKMASGPNRADGVARVWMDGRLVIDRRDANSYSDRFPYTDRGYLMGYDNARFDQTTFIYIDDVRFYTSNPGW